MVVGIGGLVACEMADGGERGNDGGESSSSEGSARSARNDVGETAG